MSTITIRCGDWSETIQSDDEYFKTLLSSYVESTGEVPSILSFDSWTWLPEQWEHWVRLRDKIELSTRHVIYYADVEVITSAMIDLPEGWECLTIIDERVDKAKRLRLYESIGKDFHACRPNRLTLIHLLDSLLYYTSVSPIDKRYSRLIAGFTSNAESLADELRLPIWQVAMWSDLREFYENHFLPLVASLPFDVLNDSLRDTLHTTRYFITNRVTIIDSIIYSSMTLSIGYVNFDRIMLYKSNIEAYLATEDMAWTHLRIGPDPLLTTNVEPTRVDAYALSVHCLITLDAGNRLLSLTNLKTSSDEGKLMWGRITGVLLLWSLGRDMIKKILTLSKRRGVHYNTFKYGLIEILERYQNDENVRLEMISTSTSGRHKDKVKSMLDEYQ